MNTVNATGNFVDAPPHVSISGGMGNIDDVTEIHMMMRDPETGAFIQAWFPYAAIKAALDAAVAVSGQTRLSEPFPPVSARRMVEA